MTAGKPVRRTEEQIRKFWRPAPSERTVRREAIPSETPKPREVEIEKEKVGSPG